MAFQRGENSEYLGIEIDKTDPNGEFYWDVRPSTQNPTGPQSNFELLVWLGQMPDTNTLSNKLISLVGEHVFDMLYERASYKSIFSFLQNSHENAAELFDPLEQKSLWHCWRLIAKLRALQEIDYLFNLNNLPEAELKHRIEKAKTALLLLYPNPPFALDSREQQEFQWLKTSLDELFIQLSKTAAFEERNALLQSWQQVNFRGLIAEFQKTEGEISAAQHHILPRENWENTRITREAETILQNWTFGETGYVRDSMLFRNDPGEVFHSASYHDIDKRSLLFTAVLGEKLGPDLGIDLNELSSVAGLNKKNGEDKFLLHRVRDGFDDLKEDIKATTISIKEKLAQETPTVSGTELDESSKLFSEWWDQWYTTIEHAEILKNALHELKIEDGEPEEKAQPAIKEEAPRSIIVTTPLADGVASGYYSLTRPAESNYVYVAGDAVSASLRFLADFAGYFDQMMDKHPFTATATFSIPYLQFGGIGLAMKGNDALLGIANLFAALEAKLLGGKVTATQINEIVRVVDEAILWFTSAESALQVLITCGFTISKVSYTIVDVLVDELLNKSDETTLTELANKLDPTGSLAGTTNREALQNHLITIFSGLALLTVAGGVGVAADLCHSAALEFLAHVPATLITNPSLQTLGALKTSALLIGKLAGINNYISKEQLMDTNGTRLTTKSSNYRLLILFAKLASGHKKLQPGQKNSIAFKNAVHYFEQLLQLNPQLLPLYNTETLKELGVKKSTSAWYQRLALACFKSVFYALLFVPALFAHLYYALAQKPLPPMWSLGLAIPLNWLVLTGKLFWTSGKAAAHGFLQVAVRLPEVALQLSFVAARFVFGTLGNSLAIAGGYFFKALGYLIGKEWCSDPFNTSPAKFFAAIGDTLKNAQILAVGWLRINFRYRIEQFVGLLLKWGRDLFVRKAEQWLQRAFMPVNTPDCIEDDSTEVKLSATAYVQQHLEQEKGALQANNEQPSKENKPSTQSTTPSLYQRLFHPTPKVQDKTVAAMKPSVVPTYH